MEAICSFNQKGFPLKANTQYRLSFAAFSNAGHDLKVYVQKDTAPFSNYGLNNQQFNLSGSWQFFTHEFTTSGFSGTTTDTRVRFWFVGEAINGDIFWLDDVRLEEVNISNPTSTPTSTSTPTATWTPDPGYTPTNTPTPTATALSAAQNINLQAGWNLISSYVNPTDPALETLMVGINSSMYLMKNGLGQIYWPAMAINEIGDWDIREGYLIFMNNPDTLVLNGTEINPGQTVIQLFSGYNMVSYLPNSALPVGQALAGINGSLELVKNRTGSMYWPEYGVNQIGNMQPGEGYELFLSNGANLVYPGN